MTDTLLPIERHERMKLIHGKNTKPEMVARRLIYSAGYRYRLHRRDLPGCPDIVFQRRKKIIFVHGCFWHRHPDPTCKLARLPKSRLDYWLPKLEANRHRDEANQAALLKLGWKVMVIWECEIKNAKEVDLKNILDKITLFLNSG
jgi:DNA mismatch endonuclease (patch repair protein)